MSWNPRRKCILAPQDPGTLVLRSALGSTRIFSIDTPSKLPPASATVPCIHQQLQLQWEQSYGKQSDSSEEFHNSIYSLSFSLHTAFQVHTFMCVHTHTHTFKEWCKAFLPSYVYLFFIMCEINSPLVGENYSQHTWCVILRVCVRTTHRLCAYVCLNFFNSLAVSLQTFVYVFHIGPFHSLWHQSNSGH